MIFIDDLDLLVLTPGNNTIYYNNKFDPETGGSLDVDFRPGVDRVPEFGTWTENINIPSTGTNGAYTVWVNQYNVKKEMFPDRFTLQIFDDTAPTPLKYSKSFPGLGQGESTPCISYDKPSGTIIEGTLPCE